MAVGECEGGPGVVIDNCVRLSGVERRKCMVVGKYEGNGVWRVTINECEEASIGVILACARNEGMNNNVHICSCSGERARMVV